MASLQPYPKYYPVSYDYASQLPDGWQLLPNIAIFQERIERGYENEELLSVTIGRGVIKQANVDIKKDSSNEDKSKYKLIKVGDIAYNKMRMWQGALGYSNYQGISSPAYVILKPKLKINPRYFHYMFRSSFYTNYSKRFSYGIVDDQLSLRYTDFKRMYSIVPPLEVQNNIVSYLDKKNKEIDKFIRNKERLIELLEEEKRLIISNEISGKNLEGKKENDWNKISLKSACKVIDCKHVTPSYSTEGIPIVSPGELKPYRIDYLGLRLVNSTDFKNVTEGGRLPIKGDILYSRNASVGSACYVDGDSTFCMGQDVCLIRSKKFDGRYLEHLLNSDLVLTHVESILIGATIRRINISEIKRLKIYCPPLEIQTLICSRIKDFTYKIDLAISKAQKEISSIKEYREALITDLVTGRRSIPQLQKS
jgi:type I restriction enzyme S subunit